MVDLVVWAGPVASFQLPGATVPGAKTLFLGCRGDKGPHAWCPAVGDELAPSPSLLLDRANVSRANLGRLFLGAFSAGGSVLRRLLANSDYRDLTTAVMLSDATFTASWANAARREPPPIEPFVLWALDVLEASGEKLFVATASPSPNAEWATGVENLQALRTEIEKRSGRRFARLSGFFGVDPAPAAAYQLGGVILAEYPMRPLGHDHVKIAGQVWRNILQPFLEGDLPRSGGRRPADPAPVLIRLESPARRGAKRIAGALAAVAALAALIVALGRRRRPT